jgi:hypothetical protein
MKKQQYTNRHNDIFIFTPTKEGNILWEGKFEYARCGYENDYSLSYQTYLNGGGEMSLKEFKEKVHEYDYETKSWKMGEKLNKLITSDTSKLNMVDPSGGPYICVGMEWMGKIVSEIQLKENSYLLIMGDNEN